MLSSIEACLGFAISGKFKILPNPVDSIHPLQSVGPTVPRFIKNQQKPSLAIAGNKKRTAYPKSCLSVKLLLLLQRETFD